MTPKKICEKKYNGEFKKNVCKINNTNCPLKNNDFVVNDDVKGIICRNKYKGVYNNNKCMIPSYDNINDYVGEIEGWDNKRNDFLISNMDTEEVAPAICKYFYDGIYDFGIHACAVPTVKNKYYDFTNEFNRKNMDFDIPKKRLKHIFIKSNKST